MVVFFLLGISGECKYIPTLELVLYHQKRRKQDVEGFTQRAILRDRDGGGGWGDVITRTICRWVLMQSIELTTDSVVPNTCGVERGYNEWGWYSTDSEDSLILVTNNVCETLQMFRNYSAIDVVVVVVLVVVETFYTQEGESLNLNPVTGGVEIIGNEDLVLWGTNYVNHIVWKLCTFVYFQLLGI